MAAIVASDIIWRKTVVSGSAGNSTAAGANGTYLGKYASTTAWAGGTINDLFDDISGAQNAASRVDYAGLAIHNSNASNNYVSPVVYISAETAGGASLAIGIDTTAASAVGSASAQMLQIANDTTAPAGVSFSSPTTLGTGLALSTINIGFVKGLWIRRSAANTSALSNDGGTITISGDTGSL